MIKITSKRETGDILLPYDHVATAAIKREGLFHKKSDRFVMKKRKERGVNEKFRETKTMAGMKLGEKQGQ
jgi:hypothetical protein